MVSEIIKDYNELCSVLEKNKHFIKEENSLQPQQRFKTPYVLVITTIIQRIFRIVLCYINERLRRIQYQYWMNGGDMSQIEEFMSQNEKDFLF